MALFKLIDDLMRDRPLRRRFGVEPREVMSEYGLSKRERRILLTMDPGEIAAKVPAEMRDEVNAFQLPPGEFPPASDDFLSEGGGLDPQYPSPAPGIFRYRINPPFLYAKDTTTTPPTILRGFSADLVNTTASGSIELTVFGQSFVDTEYSQLKLVRVKPNDGAEAAITHFHIMGTFRNSILRAVFNAPSGTWTAGQQYEVTVVNLQNTPLAKPIKAKPLLTVLT